MLPEALKDAADYTTAMVGKWDVGHYALPLWPTNRGFDASLHLSCYGYTDYNLHTNLGGYFDLHEGTSNVAWVGGIGTDDEWAETMESEYSTFVFTHRARTAIEDHTNALLTEASSSSRGSYKYPGLFIYLAWNAVHTTLSLPRGYNASSEYTELVADVDLTANPDRGLLAGALKMVDDGFGALLGDLKSSGLYDNSVVVVASDNGGSVKGEILGSVTPSSPM